MNRRAFSMPIVILLSLAGSLIVAGALQRQNVQRLLVQRQIEEYHRHHDMLGAQAIIRFWLSRQDNTRLSQLSSPDVPAHRFSLPGGTSISLYIEDGQGRVKADLTGVRAPQREWYEAILWRLPRNRPELVRYVGPAMISVNAAPRDVLKVIVEDGDALADELIIERESRPLDGVRFRQALERFGKDQATINEVTALVTFDPRLWRLRVEASSGQDDLRVFTGFAELGGTNPVIHEWREVFTPTDQDERVQRPRLRRR